jgi:hypothetical protein
VIRDAIRLRAGQARPSLTGTPRRAFLEVLAAVGLVALVAVASRGRTWPAAHAASGHAPSRVALAGLALALAVVAAAGAVAWWRLFASRPDEPRGQLSKRLLTCSAAFAALAVGVYFFIRHYVHAAGVGPWIWTKMVKPPLGVGGPPPGAKAHRPPPQATDHFSALLAGGVGVVLLLLLAAGVTIIVIRRRRRASPARSATPAEEVAVVLEETLEDLRRLGDPRRAVIAAYARMEQALSRHGLPRLRSEAPHEYLTRVLRELRATAGSARRLTDLFEWARFSQHQVDPPMREEAIDALSQLRNELATAR